ncbi:MAG TPA: hypothetical protein VF412_06030 [Bdellovibrio sp.]|uniref:hypothetical protein n=1 Tax=Bdellovibrio sp. TaxID=28201 RepID=UPI002EECC0AE
MNKFILTVFSIITMAGSAYAGCNPCICGSGGGFPPPPDCGQFSSNRQVMDLLSQPSIQNDLESRGGLTKIQSFQSENSVVYHFTTSQGEVLTTPELSLEALSF